jgi:hypothetical protein
MPRELPPNGGETPSDWEVNGHLDRSDRDLIDGPTGVSRSDRNPEPRQESLGYYEKACAKVRTFIRGLDPDLTVSVGRALVEPERSHSPEYRTHVLRFAHRTKPHLRWTMEIEPDDKYIDETLEGVVRKIYSRKAREE